jgi:hypothetical protein
MCMNIEYHYGYTVDKIADANGFSTDIRFSTFGNSICKRMMLNLLISNLDHEVHVTLILKLWNFCFNHEMRIFD